MTVTGNDRVVQVIIMLVFGVLFSLWFFFYIPSELNKKYKAFYEFGGSFEIEKVNKSRSYTVLHSVKEKYYFQTIETGKRNRLVEGATVINDGQSSYFIVEIGPTEKIGIKINYSE